MSKKMTAAQAKFFGKKSGGPKLKSASAATAAINRNTPGKSGKPGEGKVKFGVPAGTGQHPKPGTGIAHVKLNQGMDPGTAVPHAAARASSDNIPQTGTDAKLHAASKRRFGSAMVAMNAIRKG